jgi:hypothetical protein
VCLDFVVILVFAHLLTLTWVRDWATWDAHSSAIFDPGPRGSATLLMLTGVGVLLHLCYFTVSEGIWGATVGKAVCRLRVARTNREVPGVPRALLRTAIYYAATWLPLWIAYAINADRAVAGWDGDDLIFSFVLPALSTVGCVALFATARRHNGYAGLHELASGTRVVRSPAHVRRPKLSLLEEPIAETSGQEQFGPYHLLGPVTEDEPDGLLMAYDTRLLRKVWIRKCPAHAPPVPSELRTLARVGRLRWLCGARGEGEGWDAYEARSGKPLLHLTGERQPWDAVRFWLWDLTAELQASQTDGTTPEVLDLDRVWITTDGRAKLLDFPAPGADRGSKYEPADEASQFASYSTARDHSQREETKSPRQVPLFLKRVALAALEGKMLTTAEAEAARTAVPLPLSAREFLNDLGKSDGIDPLGHVESLTARPATVTLQRKLGMLVSCWMFPIIGGLYIAMMNASEARFLKEFPEVGQLCGYVSYYRALDGRESPVDVTDVMRKAVGIYVSQRFAATLKDPYLWSNPMMGQFIDESGQQLLRSFASEYEDATPEEVDEARQLVQLAILQIQPGSFDINHFPYSWPFPAVVLAVAAAFMSVFVAPFSLLSAIPQGNSLLLWIFDVAIVNRRGESASRLRVMWRSVVLWTIVVLGLALIVVLLTQFRFRVGFLLLIYFTCMIVYDMFTSERGLQDRLSGTWLVPR